MSIVAQLAIGTVTVALTIIMQACFAAIAFSVDDRFTLQPATRCSGWKQERPRTMAGPLMVELCTPWDSNPEPAA